MKYALQSIASAGLLFLTSQGAFAQTNTCGTEVPAQQWESQFQQLMQENAPANISGKTESLVYTIPVIIHVVYGTEPVGTYPNLSQAQLNSQVQVLNNDYAGTGQFVGNYPTTAFTAWAAAQSLPLSGLDASGRVKIANCNIQFCLATKDTLGNILPEPGIDRVSYVSHGWANPYSFTQYSQFKNYIDNTVKVQTIWNVSKYLNIWVTDENIAASGIGGLLGYATFPPLTGLSGLPGTGTSINDGFWCYAKVFGSASIYPAGTYYTTTYNKGRTCTHEIGHWLGLRHIWGDGTCANDYCNDTPPAAASNGGTPVYPYNSGSCAGNSPNGEMFMNFMDYTNDNGKYMFSPDQAARMSTAMANSPYRKFMGTHGLCSIGNVAANSSFSLNSSACEGSSVAINNSSFGTPAPSYSWSASGNATFIPNSSAISPSVSFASPGTYTITLAAGNGTASSSTQIITINPSPALVLSTPSQTVCTGESVNIVASGANTYVWSPGSLTSSVVSYNASANKSFTCTATGANGCKTKTAITVNVTECAGISTQHSSKTSVAVYPNPVKDRLTLQLNATSITPVTIEVMDITGKIILQQPAVFTADKHELEMDLATFENGIYILKITSKDNTQIVKLVKSGK